MMIGTLNRKSRTEFVASRAEMHAHRELEKRQKLVL